MFHLAVFLLVVKMDVPDWAKAVGYGWLVPDMITAVLTLNHVTSYWHFGPLLARETTRRRGGSQQQDQHEY